MGYDQIILKGATSNLIEFCVRSSTTGQLLTGLAAGSVTCTYQREAAAGQTAVTLDGTMVLGTWKTGGWKETGTLGEYQFGIPDAAVASGANGVTFVFKATGMIDKVFRVVLWATNPQSATAFITGVNSLAPPSNWNSMAIDGSGRVDVSKVSGTSQTARDLGASVLLSNGTGTGQLDFTSGVVKANLAQILGTALTETAGLIAAAFVKFFNKSSPTGTVNSLPDAVAGASSGVAIVGSNMGSVSSIGSGGITAASIAADAITASKIADGAIDAATFAAGAIDNAAIATDAIGSAELAASAVTKIQTGLATPTNITAGVITTVTTLTNKTGFSLASTGLDAIDTTDVTSDTNARSTFPKMIRALFNRFYNAVSQTSSAQVVKNDSGTAISTMATSDDGSTVSKNKST